MIPRLHFGWLPNACPHMPRPLERLYLALSIWRGWPDPWRDVRAFIDPDRSWRAFLGPWEREILDTYDPMADIDWPTAWEVAGGLTR